MQNAINELRRSPTPLTIPTIAAVTGLRSAQVERIVKELALPATAFAPIYSLRQIRIILQRAMDEQLESLEKGTNHETQGRSPNAVHQLGPIDTHRLALEQRREARRQARAPR
ncbi:MAG: hypothetical protein WD316_08570 [Phycisphaeraceae bacterium]